MPGPNGAFEWYPIRERRKPHAKEAKIERHPTEAAAAAHIRVLRETQPQLAYRVAVAPIDDRA